nr:hypothetical protein [Candidatus Cardinium sp. cBcalN1]
MHTLVRFHASLHLVMLRKKLFFFLEDQKNIEQEERINSLSLLVHRS